MSAALVIGISDYPSPISSLPAVAADVREIGKVLASEPGSFQNQQVEVLTEQKANRSGVLKNLQNILGAAVKGDTIFVYIAGHGAVIGGEYYFVAHDTDLSNLEQTGVPLVEIKRMFDACKSTRLILWLDFCHSGGIMARSAATPSTPASEAISRALSVVQGEGRVIYAACTPEQFAYEDAKLGHGVFTAYLLEGLKGAAAHEGEVTANSLFDFIDRKMGSSHQQPMSFGQMTGRVVLVHHPATPQPHRKLPASSPSMSSQVAEGSGNWCLLCETFHQAKNVRRLTDGMIELQIASTSADSDSVLAQLQPNRFGPQNAIAFAHRNDGLLVRVKEMESVSSDDEQVWTIRLRPEDIEYGGYMMEMSYNASDRHYSGDDFAKMRAERILLNAHPPQQNRSLGFGHDDMLDTFISGMNVPVPIHESPIPKLYRQHKSQPEVFLQLSRLAVIFLLKAGGVAEAVEQLAMGPLSNGKVHVQFRGRRRKIYSNADPVRIEVEGDCRLA